MLFPKIFYSIMSLTILARSSILRTVTGCWIYLGYFFGFTFITDLFLLLTFLNINGTATLHTNVSLTTGIPQQCLTCRLDVLVNFGQIFALFLVLLWLTLDIICYFVCSLMTYLCGKPKRFYIYGSSCKTLVSNSAND